MRILFSKMILAGCIGWGSNTWATDLSPQPMQKNLMPQALQIQLTPRGQSYFSNQLTTILGNLGVSLGEGYFDQQNFASDKPMNLDELEKTHPDEVKIFKQVRSLMTQWLVGFSLKDPRPNIQIGKSEYFAKISKLALETDQALMTSLGKTEGAVLAIEFEIKKFNTKIDQVRAWDLENPDLGNLGLDQVEINIADEVTPLKVKLPFYVRINTTGGLDFESLGISENIQTVPVELKYQKIVVPKLSVEINGNKYVLNNNELEKYVNSLTPQFIDFARKQLSQFAEKQIPELLNQKSKEFLAGGLEQVQLLEPPGAETNDQRPPFLWGLQLQKFLLKNNLLNLGLGAYIEDTYRDPKKPVAPPPLNPAFMARGQPTLNLIPTDKYDLSMVIDRGLVNRLLQLSYNRKNFEKIKLEDGSFLTLRAVPTVDFVKNPPQGKTSPTATYIKLHLAVEQAIPQNSLVSWFLDDKVVVTFDLVAKLQQVSDKSGLEIVLNSIDTNTANMDPQYLSWLGRLFKGTVMNGLKDQLKKISSSWASGKEKIPGKLAMPPQVLGMNLDIVQLTMDPTGQLVMYLNFAEKKP